MAASLVRRRVDSPMETRLRLLIVLAGLPEPEVNVEIRAVDGRLLYRIDLSYPQFRLGIEYDGRHHAENDAQWAGDITRREALDGLAWRLVVVRSPGVYLDPGQTIDRIVAVMTQVGMPLPAGAPHEGWRRHFPGRS